MWHLLQSGRGLLRRFTIVPAEETARSFPRQAQQRRRQDAREHHGERHPPEGLPLVGVEVHGRLLEPWVESGHACLHRDHDEADAEHEVDLVTKYGVDAKQLDLATSLEQEPILKDSVKAVVEFSTDFGLDPGKLVEVYRRNCEAIGVTFRNEKVTGLSSTSRNVTVVTSTDSWICDYVVLAAGVWSRDLAKTLGENLPIMPAKGQSVTLPGVTNRPSRTLMLADQRIATNPLDWGFRMSTGFALTSSSDMSVNSKATEKLIATARQALNLPDKFEVKNELAGLRPASPDGMPYIGALPKAPRVIAATGHGMLGLMMGPGTGKFVSDLVAGRPVSRDVLKFSPARPRI